MTRELVVGGGENEVRLLGQTTRISLLSYHAIRSWGKKEVSTS